MKKTIILLLLGGTFAFAPTASGEPFWMTSHEKGARATTVFYYTASGNLMAAEQIPGRLSLRRKAVKRKLNNRLQLVQAAHQTGKLAASTTR